MAGPLVLVDEDAHYLGHVLRAKPLQEIETFDGDGGIDRWEITQITRRVVSLKHLAHKDVDRRAPLKLKIGLNPLKGGNEEIVIRMAAAMEVAAICPVIFERSEIPMEKSILDKRIDRWRRLCINEVALSGGSYLPVIELPTKFVDDILPPSHHGFLFYEEADLDLPDPLLVSTDEVIAYLGPEGGLERVEVDIARERGIKLASLGDWTLRAELAGALIPAWVYSRIL